MATTAQLVTRLQARFNDPTGDIYSSANVLSYLNDAYAWFNARSPWWPWKETKATNISVTANTNSATLPTDVWRVSLVRHPDGQVLRPFGNRTQHAVHQPVLDDTGTPSMYRVFNNTLEVFPAPVTTTAFIVEYWGPESALVSGSVDPVIPDEHQQGLIEYALFLMYTDDDDVQTAQTHLAAAGDAVQMALDDLQGGRQDSGPILVDDWYD